MRKLNTVDLNGIIAGIPAPVYLPVENGGLVTFGLYGEGVSPCFDRVVTDKSPKDIMFPQWENLMRLRMEGKNISLTEQSRCDEDFVIFGTRACDVRALEVLDRVFLADPVDTFYQSRRSHGTIVAFACTDMEPTCFCKNFGVDPAAPAGDIVIWRGESVCYCEAYSEKGSALLSAWNTEECGDEAVVEIKAEIGKKYDSLPFASLPMEGLDGEHLMELFNSPRWEKLSLACIGCGTCTFSCPTCQCYDVREYDTGHGVERYRCWDSCMYSDFTMMASGNPRTTQMQRFRQRFMHKLVYFPANNDGMYSCVGCGRCVKKCPQSLNIVKVIRALGKDR